MLNFDTYKPRPYKHIDRRVTFDKVKNDVLTPSWVASHSFLPFIHYKIVFQKYVGYNQSRELQSPIKEKCRDIYYAGHLDSYIYRYYSDLLNEAYNHWGIDNDIEDVSVAYRTNKSTQSNINFSASAIAKISESEASLVIIGDFESYFDTLDHLLLKKRLMRVLKTTYLSKDWYNIYKSVTKFGYLLKQELDTLDNGARYSYFNTIKEFREYQKHNKISYNRKEFGIPQGSPISGVLANVYAIDFDLEMVKIASRYDGFYQRYSDDFILILPLEKLQHSDIKDLSQKMLNDIEFLAESNKIRIQSEKLDCKVFCLNEIKDVFNQKRGQIDYLGFVFDGKKVKLREKSIGKFYREARKLIRKAQLVKKKKGLKKLPFRHKIYSLYTDFGASEIYRSNFIDYAKRAQRIFDDISPLTDNLMLDQLKNRKSIVEKELGYRIHSRL